MTKKLKLEKLIESLQFATHHIRWTQRTKRVLAIRYPCSLVIFVDRPVSAQASRMRWRVMIRTVCVHRLRLMHGLPYPNVFLECFFCNHQSLLLHVELILLVEAVQPMYELVLTVRVHLPADRADVRLMGELVCKVVLLVSIGVVLLTANKVIVGVDLDVLQTLTTQGHLMTHDGLALERKV